MHVDAMENLAEKRERVERLKEEAAQKARPKLSAKSLEIAEQLDETAKQRLLKPRPVVMSPKIDPELTFAPQINAKSQQILSEKQDTIRNPHVRLHKEAIERISRRKGYLRYKLARASRAKPLYIQAGDRMFGTKLQTRYGNIR